MLLSADPDIVNFPLELKATQRTLSLWFPRMAFKALFFKSHNKTEVSSEPLTINKPFVLTDMQFTDSL